MILQADIWFFEVVKFFGKHSAWFLLGAGAIMMLWVYTGVISLKKGKDEDGLRTQVKVGALTWSISIGSMVYGFFLMLGGVMAIFMGSSPSLMYRIMNGEVIDPTLYFWDVNRYSEAVNIFTIVLYIFIGMMMFFKPLKDVPWAAMISFGVAAVIVIIAMVAIPEHYIGAYVIDNYVALKWILVIIFIAVVAVTYMAAKAALEFIIKFSKIVSHPIGALIMGGLVIVQAIMLIAGYSIIPY